jgi:hypothetical protein
MKKTKKVINNKSLLLEKLFKLGKYINQYQSRIFSVQNQLGERASNWLFECFNTDDKEILIANLTKLNKYICQFPVRSTNVSNSLGDRGCLLLNESFKLIELIIEDTNKMNNTKLENYRTTMTLDVLHSWGADAQAKINSLSTVIQELLHASTPSFSSSPEGRSYLLKSQKILDTHLENHRKSMTEEVLHSWGADAQAKIKSLIELATELKEAKTDSFSSSPEGREYLLTIDNSINM